jgi:hypothetical protein
MSITTIYPFTTPADYVYNTSLIEITGGEAKLKLVDNPDQDFTEDFSDDTGFIYDSAKAEFVGGVCRQKSNNITENYNQSFSADTGFTYDNTKSEFTGGVCRTKDQRPANSTCGATYTNDINLNWGNGTLTGTAVGGASVSGGKLDLTGGGKYVRYSATNNASSLQEGCVRFRFTPNYSNLPATDMALYSISTSFGDFSCYTGLRHTVAGQVEMSILNNAGSAIVSVYLGGWLPTSGTEYEFEMNWDITAGATRLFINGVQFGSTQAGTGTRTGAIASLVIGAYYTGGSPTNGKFDDIEIFSTVQHTSGYAIGYTVPENIYLESVVTAPIQSYNYNVVSLDVPTITETNAPRYVVNGYYWDGGAWSASSNTYATAMTSAQWVTNIATFPAEQLSTGVTVKTVFQSSNTLSSIDNIAFIINESTYLENSVIGPEMEYTGAGTLVSFDTFTTTEISAPRYTLQIGRSGNYLYWSGAAWVASDGTYAQSNDKATFQAHLTTLPVLGEIYGQFKIHFQNSGTQSSISALEAILTAQIYPVTNPTITLAANLRLEGITNFVETVTKSGLDNIKYVLKNGSGYVYWDSTAWVASSGVYAQSNTASEILTNIASFTTTAITFNIKILLHSDDGKTTPAIQELSITYNYAGNVEDSFNLCDVYWYSRNADGTVDTTPFYIKLKNADKGIRYKTNIMLGDFDETVNVDADGYVEVSLIDNTNMISSLGTPYYEIKKNSKVVANIIVPETDGELLWNLIF